MTRGVAHDSVSSLLLGRLFGTNKDGIAADGNSSTHLAVEISLPPWFPYAVSVHTNLDVHAGGKFSNMQADAV